MGRALSALYAGCGWLAGVCLVAMLGMILLNIAGGSFGFFIPGLDAYAGYLLASALLLGLAPTLRAGEHIRVTLLIRRLSPGAARATEIVALLLAVACAIGLAVALTRTAILSWRFEEVSQMVDATPLWLPQSGAALGAVVFAIAVLHELVEELTGRRVGHRAGDEPARIE